MRSRIPGKAEVSADGLGQADGGGALALAQRGRVDPRHHDVPPIGSVAGLCGGVGPTRKVGGGPQGLANDVFRNPHPIRGGWRAFFGGFSAQHKS